MTATQQKGGQLARLAASFCRQKAFRSFLEVESEDQAREFILVTCGVHSRAELDHDGGAADAFHKHVRRPYLAWQEKGNV